MNIAVNTRFLLKDKMEGFGWYTYEVTKRLVLANPSHTFYFFFDRPYDKQFVFAENVIPVVLSPPARHPILFILWNEWSVRRALKKHRIDLFFSPDGYLSLSSKVKQIAVIHDINFVHFPKDIPFLASLYLRKFFPLFAKKANKIVTVSEYSKKDLVASYGVNPEKIVVTWNDASPLYQVLEPEKVNQVRAELTQGKKYFLFVGSLQPRKNLKTLLKAYQVLLEEQDSEWDLVIVGSKMWNQMQNWEESDKWKERVHFTGHLPQDRLVEVMGAAGAFVYVPYFEGFGIPLVESMRSGVPIVCGNLTALPEVVGEAALLCDPLNEKELAQKMAQLENDPALQAQLIAKGLERSKLFSWDQSADKIWKEIQKLV